MSLSLDSFQFYLILATKKQQPIFSRMVKHLFPPCVKGHRGREDTETQKSEVFCCHERKPQLRHWQDVR